MKNKYCISGPATLLKAANEEMKLVGQLNDSNTKGLYLPNPISLFLFLESGTFWMSYGNSKELSGYESLSLPDDWGKLMDVIATYNVKKLPEFVRGVSSDRNYKVFSDGDNIYWVYDVFGNKGYIRTNLVNEITEIEFIQGGLKEIKNEGFSEGDRLEIKKSKEDVSLLSVCYARINPTLTLDEVWDAKGFCFKFHTTNGVFAAGDCKKSVIQLTQNGIQYKKLDINEVLISPYVKPILIQTSEIRNWMASGVISIKFPCGTLESEDFKILTTP